MRASVYVEFTDDFYQQFISLKTPDQTVVKNYLNFFSFILSSFNNTQFIECRKNVREEEHILAFDKISREVVEECFVATEINSIREFWQFVQRYKNIFEDGQKRLKNLHDFDMILRRRPDLVKSFSGIVCSLSTLTSMFLVFLLIKNITNRENPIGNIFILLFLAIFSLTTVLSVVAILHSLCRPRLFYHSGEPTFLRLNYLDLEQVTSHADSSAWYKELCDCSEPSNLLFLECAQFNKLSNQVRKNILDDLMYCNSESNLNLAKKENLPVNFFSNLDSLCTSSWLYLRQQKIDFTVFDLFCLINKELLRGNGTVSLNFIFSCEKPAGSYWKPAGYSNKFNEKEFTIMDNLIRRILEKRLNNTNNYLAALEEKQSSQKIDNELHQELMSLTGSTNYLQLLKKLAEHLSTYSFLINSKKFIFRRLKLHLEQLKLSSAGDSTEIDYLSNLIDCLKKLINPDKKFGQLKEENKNLFFSVRGNASTSENYYINKPYFTQNKLVS